MEMSQTDFPKIEGLFLFRQLRNWSETRISRKSEENSEAFLTQNEKYNERIK
jgi:hypothetical protein